MYYENGDLFVQAEFEDDVPKSGQCGNGKQLTNAHLLKIQKYFSEGNALEYAICD